MDCVLMPSEIEFYIETMRPGVIQDIGNSRWLEWHERFQKLNQQALLEASQMKEEYVKETLISFNKSPILVHEAILISVWKQKILPILLKLQSNPETSIISYSVLYHEVVAANLLELIMFHSGGCESLGDSAADLLDYAYDNVTMLLVIETKPSESLEKSGLKEITKRKDDMAFDVGIKCLSIIRYLVEYMERMSLSISSRIYTVHDVPALLIQILLERPWYKNDKVYNMGKWVDITTEAIPKVEIQVWVTLWQMLLDAACVKHYTMTDSRRVQLMKLLPMMTPNLLDQLSHLVELKHWLCKLSVSNLPTGQQPPLLLEAVLEVKEGIIQQANKKWKTIARSQLETIFCSDKEKLVDTAQRLCSAYNTDFLEQMENQATAQGSCTLCGKEASRRCSKCKGDWYCSRKCQVDDWKNHKEKCMA